MNKFVVGALLLLVVIILIGIVLYLVVNNTEVIIPPTCNTGFLVEPYNPSDFASSIWMTNSKLNNGTVNGNIPVSSATPINWYIVNNGPNEAGMVFNYFDENGNSQVLTSGSAPPGKTVVNQSKQPALLGMTVGANMERASFNSPKYTISPSLSSSSVLVLTYDEKGVGSFAVCDAS